MKTLRLGTRGSELALAQAKQVSADLKAAHPDVEIEVVVIRTTGDERLDIDLTNPGPLDKGLFTKELERALLAGTIDAAVHSLKDLPVELPEGLVLGAVPLRADPSDVVVSKHRGGLDGLPENACVATSSARRAAMVSYFRPDLRIVAIRGNVPTRLRKLAEDPALDAVILARAGLDRLSSGVVPAGLFVEGDARILPAPGQGALGIECRAGDEETRQVLSAIHDEDTARCVHAERAMLAALGGGCAVPLGALGELINGRVVLRTLSFGEPSAGK
ncbi:MAG: hydroxymethylbilane synthase [Terrimicrobiaceae bacterium]